LVFESFRQFLREYGSHISMGGMFIGARRPLPPGSLCQLEFRLRDGYPLILGRGEVVWTRAREEGPGRPPGMGVRFHELEGSTRDLVFGIVEHRLAEGDSLFRLDEDGDLMDESPENLDKLLKEAERRRERAESEARSSGIGSTQKLSAGAILAKAQEEDEDAGSSSAEEESGAEASVIDDEPELLESGVDPEAEDSDDEMSLLELEERRPGRPLGASRQQPSERISATDAGPDSDDQEALAEDLPEEDQPLLALPYDGDPVAEEEGWELEDARSESAAASSPARSAGARGEDLWTGPAEVIREGGEAGRWDAGDLHTGVECSGARGSGHPPFEDVSARRSRDEELGQTLRDMPMPSLSEREPDLPVTVGDDESMAGLDPRQTSPRGRPMAGHPMDSADAMDLDQLFSVAPAADPLSMEDRPDPWMEREEQRRKRRRTMIGTVVAVVLLAGAAFLLVRLAGWWPPASDPAQENPPAAVVDASGDPSSPDSASPPAGAPEVIDVGGEEPAAETSDADTASPAPPPPASPPPPSTSQAAATSVQDIRWTRSGDTTRVTVTLDGVLPESRFTNQRLGSGAPRQLLRLRGITQAFRPPTLEVDTDQLLRIRTGRHIRDGADELHLVLDLAAAGVSVTRVESQGRTLEIWVSGGS
jgi:uncharacterized protein (TIGR02266 family)